MATNELNHYGALNTKNKNYVLQCAIDQNCTMLFEAEITLSFPKYFYAVSSVSKLLVTLPILPLPVITGNLPVIYR